MSDEKKITMVAEVDPYELAVRIMEAESGYSRPIGLGARAAYEMLPKETQKTLMITSRAAYQYFQEIIKNNMQRVQ